VLKALPDIDLGTLIDDISGRFLGLLQAGSVLRPHRSQKADSRGSKMFEQQGVGAFALPADIAAPTSIQDQLVDTLKARWVQSVTPAGAVFWHIEDSSSFPYCTNVTART
jgi:hypothetical protein